MNLAMGQVAKWVWFPIGVTIRFLTRNGKRIAVSVAGLVLLVLGLAMMVLPGPGILFLLAGLAVLATEYVWAQRMLNYAKTKAEQAKNAVTGKKSEANGGPPGDAGPDVGP
jgi:uncharacterized protein (TIGR02611 family)